MFSPARRARVTYLIERASESNIKSAIVVKSWPQYTVLQLDGPDIRYSVAWESIFQLAERNHECNLRVEARRAQKLAWRRKAN